MNKRTKIPPSCPCPCIFFTVLLVQTCQEKPHPSPSFCNPEYSSLEPFTCSDKSTLQN